MAVETVVPRSRRALLAATVGGLAALAGGALGRPSPARATHSGDVSLDHPNTTTTPTTITNTTDAALALGGYATGSGWGVKGTASSGTGVQGDSSSGTGVGGSSTSGPGVAGNSTTNPGVYGSNTWSIGVSGNGAAYGVYGSSGSGAGVAGVSSSGYGVGGRSDSSAGVHGTSGSYRGVWGDSSSGTGVWGYSISGTGVWGESYATDRAATVGRSKANAGGLLGYSGGLSDSLPATPARTGVYGYAAQDGSSRGVTGQTKAGRGVNGVATSGRGVNGHSSTGVGVYAASGSAGKAFHAEGRVSFKTSGLASIGASASSVAVTPGVDLTSTSMILCTLMGNAGGATTVKRVAVNTTANTFTIYLTAASAAPVKLAWFVIG